MFYLTTHSTHFIYGLYGVRHMIKDHSDSEKGNPLPPHRLLFPINSKGSFICTIPQTVVIMRERVMFYLTTHSTHFIYGYMASDIWLRTTQIVRKGNPLPPHRLLLSIIIKGSFICTIPQTG